MQKKIGSGVGSESGPAPDMSKIPNTALVFISGTDNLTPDHSFNDRLT
jgi:hypothetical protein